MASLSTQPIAQRPRPAGRVRDPFDVQHLACEPAERQVLAGLLDLIDRDSATAREVASTITAEMFHATDGASELFDALRKVLTSLAAPTQTDVLTALRRDGCGQGTTPHSLLIDLAGERIGTGPAAARLAREAAVELRAVHERRQAVEAAASVVSSSGNPDDIGGMIRHLERVRAATDANGRRPMTLIDCIDAWARHERTPVVPTGLSWFDRPTEGGLPIAGITALAAYPKVGKSVLALQLTLAALLHDPELRAVWGLGEMASHGIGRRMACVASSLLPGLRPVTMREAGERTKDSRAAAVALCSAIGERFSVVEPPLTMDAIEGRVAATGARIVVIDYLQLMRGPDLGVDRVQELDHLIGRIREMAIARECAVIVISSMARSASTASRAGQIAKGSGEIDYAVELLYLGEREERDGEPVIAEDGTVGVTWHCKAARNLEHRNLVLRLDGAMQTYTAAGFDDFAGFPLEPAK